jgi:TonB family protein
MPSPERFQWLRRDGAPLAVSLALHVIVLLLIAPWLVMRTIPEQPIEIEVMLEPVEAARQRTQPDPAARRSTATRPDPSPAKPVPVRTVEVELQSEPDQTRQAEVVDESASSGMAGSGVPSLQEAAGLSGSLAGNAAPSTAADESAGVTALGATPTLSSPLLPSVASTPQPSSSYVAPTARAGEDRQEGQLNLAGPAPQARALQPEFRQAARLGGSESLRGGSRAPEDGLATQPGSASQTSPLRSLAVPPTLPGTSGRGPALAALAPTVAAQRSVVTDEGTRAAPRQASEPVVGRSAQPVSRTPSSATMSTAALKPGSTAAVTPAEQGVSAIAGRTSETTVGRSAAPVSRTPSGATMSTAALKPGSTAAVTPAAQGLSPVQGKAGEQAIGRSATPVGRSPSGAAMSTAALKPGSTGTAAPAERGLSPVQGKAGEHAVGRSALPASLTPSGGGLSTAGQGLGSSGTVPPGERGAGLVAATTPGMAATLPGATGSAREGAGPGSGDRGESRATLLAGTGLAGRDSGTLQKASGSGSADAVVDGGQGHLSSSPETVTRAEALREDRVVAMQTQQPTGQAKVVEERFSAVAMKVDSPRSVCELPLMFAGFDRKPIPKGLDTINATEPMVGEIPPRHHPSNLAPNYPMPALLQRAEGRVLVRAEIRPDGRVGKLWIKQPSGFQTLDHAAIETVRAWRFYPAQRHGMAVAMWMDVPIEYKVP